MKDYILDQEEAQILKDFEEGKFVSVGNLAQQKKYYQQIAKNTLNKTKNINIRLTERTLLRLKAKAMEEGIPYQTLASSILHKYANK